MALLKNEDGTVEAANEVLVRFIKTMKIEVVLTLGDEDPEPWTEEEIHSAAVDEYLDIIAADKTGKVVIEGIDTIDEEIEVLA